jgi:signal peptidase I
LAFSENLKKERKLKISWKRNIVLFWKGWGYSLLIAVLVATSFKSAIADWNIVPTGSMKPTILEGDRIFVNKLAYDLKVPYTTWHLAEWSSPERGDIVVFYSPADGTRLVKRVVGLPGDSIAMRDNTLFINGNPLNYESVDIEPDERISSQYCLTENLTGRIHPVMITMGRTALRSFRPVTVPDGSYFMMGDNQDNSADSRYFGFVERDLIVGEATSIVASLDIKNYYLPRWERFFTQLF